MYAEHRFSVMRQELLREEVARHRAVEEAGGAGIIDYVGVAGIQAFFLHEYL